MNKTILYVHGRQADKPAKTEERKRHGNDLFFIITYSE